MYEHQYDAVYRPDIKIEDGALAVLYRDPPLTAKPPRSQRGLSTYEQMRRKQAQLVAMTDPIERSFRVRDSLLLFILFFIL